MEEVELEDLESAEEAKMEGTKLWKKLGIRAGFGSWEFQECEEGSS